MILAAAAAMHCWLAACWQLARHAAWRPGVLRTGLCVAVCAEVVVGCVLAGILTSFVGGRARVVRTIPRVAQSAGWHSRCMAALRSLPCALASALPWQAQAGV